MPGILSNYGPPSEVWLLPSYGDPIANEEFNRTYSLYLVYEEQHFSVSYKMPKEVIGKNIVGCPWKAAYIDLGIWPPGYESLISLEGTLWKTIEEATSMTLDEFYQEFRDPANKNCIEAPSNLWQP